MTHILNIKIKSLRYIIFLSFIAIWLSVSTKFKDLLIFHNNNDLDLYDLINFLRHLCVYIILLFSIIIILKKQIKINNLSKILILYFVLQCVGLYFTSNSIENISFVISSISFIFLTVLFGHYFESNEYKLIVLIMTIIIILVTAFSFVPNLIPFILGQSPIYGASYEDSFLFLNKDSPRSSGIARSLLVLFLLNYFYKKSYRSKSLFVATNIIILSFIILNQSRLIIFLTMISLLLISLYENENYFLNILKKIFFYILIPFILFVSVSLIHSKNYTDLRVKKLENYNASKDKIEKELKNKRSLIRKIKSDNFSSGRVQDWKSLLNKFQSKNILFGYGSLGDRYLINQSASNGLIYAIVSSGIIGTIFFIIASSLIFFHIIKKLFFHTKDSSFQAKILSIIILTILLRSILETSYAVFGLDFLILYTSITILQKRKIND